MVATDVKNLWNKASLLQTINALPIWNKIRRSYEKYTICCKALEAGKFSKLVNDFQNDVETLFDVSLCKCQVTELRILRGKVICCCPKLNRILINEFNFLMDQCGESKLFIVNSIDKKCSKKYITSKLRTEKQSSNQTSLQEL